MAISVDQRFALLAKLGENADWDSLTTEQVQLGVLDGRRVGQEFTAFMRNGFWSAPAGIFRSTDDVYETICIPALPRPTPKELERFEIRKILNDISPQDAVILQLGTVLHDHEEEIDGLAYYGRLAAISGRFGFQQLKWLVHHRDEYPVFNSLLDGINLVYIDGTGLEVLDHDCQRCFPSIHCSGHSCCVSFRPRSGRLGINRLGRIAVGGKRQ